MIDAKQIANTMIQQFGGNRAFTMIGLKSVVYGTTKSEENIIHSGSVGDVYIDIKFKAKSAKVNGKSPNGLRIVYNVNSDLYSMVFYRVHGLNVSELKVVEMVYCDMLKEIFEDTTKLYLSL